MNGKSFANYDKLGHKLAQKLKSKKVNYQPKLTYISTTYPYKKIKETAKITDDKSNYV
jgi:hypothetical protein